DPDRRDDHPGAACAERDEAFRPLELVAAVERRPCLPREALASLTEDGRARSEPRRALASRAWSWRSSKATSPSSTWTRLRTRRTTTSGWGRESRARSSEPEGRRSSRRRLLGARSRSATRLRRVAGA